MRPVPMTSPKAAAQMALYFLAMSQQTVDK